MTYEAPIDDLISAITGAGGFAAESETFPIELVRTILEEAGRFATERIAPLNRVTDRDGPRLLNGVVTMTPGVKPMYEAWCAAGWNAVSASGEWGGQGLPFIAEAACREIWNAASMSFGIGPTLTDGAIEALLAHGSDPIRACYVPPLVGGRWMGTMNLTEPQSGSDLSGIRTRAERAPDGSYRLFGQKIYITFGEHDLAENIIHLVLARLADAPAGTKGLSLFLVPKFLVEKDGSLGARNDVVCVGIEHKLGLHGSPTCTMQFGEKDGATGYLVGEENRGLNCMFTMMNRTRLAVGIQGVAIADRAFQQARSFAAGRWQGRNAAGDVVTIDRHPDVRRMLQTMQGLTAAARMICMKAAAAIARAEHDDDPAARRESDAMASLLTPIAKAFATDIGVEVASIGIQVHGGMGFIEETGAAQHLRDARIGPIYEGTNGIQAIDLVTRRLGDGAMPERLFAEIDAIVASGDRRPGLGLEDGLVCLSEAVDALRDATRFLIDALGHGRRDAALSGATPYLRMLALAIGGGQLIQRAAVSGSEADIRLARSFAMTQLPMIAALKRSVTDVIS